MFLAPKTPHTKPKLEVKMQSVSDDDVRKSHVLSWRRKVYSDWECYIFRQ